MEPAEPPPTARVHAAPIARFGGHVFGGIALFVLIAFGAVVLGWLVDLLAAVKFSIWGVTLGVDPFVIQILYGAKLFILSVDVVLLVSHVHRDVGLAAREGDHRMGEVLRAFWQGLVEAPRAFVAPLFSALESVRRVVEAHPLPH